MEQLGLKWDKLGIHVGGTTAGVGTAMAPFDTLTFADGARLAPNFTEAPAWKPEPSTVTWVPPVVAPKLGELQISQPRLARAEQLAAAADVEVLLGELEPIGRAHERLESLDGGLGQVLARARDQ